MDSGFKRGFKDSEIVDAVICAISPHSSLRDHMETLSVLSLQNYGEFSLSTIGRKLDLRCIKNLQPYTNKAMNHLQLP